MKEVRLVDVEGNQLGVVTKDEALVKAKAANLDLVEVSPNSSPPVCRVMDYGKYLFELRKRKAAAKKKQRQIHVKELKFRPVTDEGDFNVKLRNAIRFLEAGDKVKITMRFRGREMLHQDLGEKIMKRLQVELEELGVIEQFPKMEGKQMIMIIAPKTKKS